MNLDSTTDTCDNCEYVGYVVISRLLIFDNCVFDMLILEISRSCSRQISMQWNIVAFTK